MNTTVRGLSPILDGYLAELDAATAHLPADEQYEIRSSIEEHIADHLTDPGHISDDDARRIVRDLGPVSSIVAPVPRGSTTPTTAPAPATGPNSSRVAVVLATVTTATMFFFPLFAAIAGLLAIGFGITGLSRREPNRSEAWIAIVCGVLPFALMGVMALLG